MNPARLFTTLSFLIATALSGCSGLEPLNAITSSRGTTAVYNLPYGPTNPKHPRLTLDVYQPATPLPGRPVVLFFYGGSWQKGNKYSYRFLGRELAKQGLTTVVANYRVAPEGLYPTFLEDSAKALVWVHQNIHTLGGNPNALFVAGHSAGAYNALMLALNPTYLTQAGSSPSILRGAISVAGPANFLPLTDPKLIRIFNGNNRPETQPITYARNNAPPILLLHGLSDTTVIPRNSITLAEALKAKGSQAQLITYPGIGHIKILLAFSSPFQSYAPVRKDILSFIEAHTPIPQP